MGEGCRRHREGTSSAVVTVVTGEEEASTTGGEGPIGAIIRTGAVMDGGAVTTGIIVPRPPVAELCRFILFIICSTHRRGAWVGTSPPGIYHTVRSRSTIRQRRCLLPLDVPWNTTASTSSPEFHRVRLFFCVFLVVAEVLTFVILRPGIPPPPPPFPPPPPPFPPPPPPLPPPSPSMYYGPPHAFVQDPSYTEPSPLFYAEPTLDLLDVLTRQIDYYFR